MENEIKVGDWIRTSDGYIGKIIEKRINEKDKYIIDVLPNVILQLNRDFVKHSLNLIDLIQCGDYVNGKEVTEIKEWNSSKDGYFRYVVTCHYEIIRVDEIKTVVTKEMMESISYKVKE